MTKIEKELFITTMGSSNNLAVSMMPIDFHQARDISKYGKSGLMGFEENQKCWMFPRVLHDLFGIKKLDAGRVYKIKITGELDGEASFDKGTMRDRLRDFVSTHAGSPANREALESVDTKVLNALWSAMMTLTTGESNMSLSKAMQEAKAPETKGLLDQIEKLKTQNEQVKIWKERAKQRQELIEYWENQYSAISKSWSKKYDALSMRMDEIRAELMREKEKNEPSTAPPEEAPAPIKKKATKKKVPKKKTPENASTSLAEAK